MKWNFTNNRQIPTLVDCARLKNERHLNEGVNGSTGILVKLLAISQLSDNILTHFADIRSDLSVINTSFIDRLLTAKILTNLQLSVIPHPDPHVLIRSTKHPPLLYAGTSTMHVQSVTN